MFQRIRYTGKDLQLYCNLVNQNVLVPGVNGFTPQNTTGFVYNLWEMTNGLFEDGLEVFLQNAAVRVFHSPIDREIPAVLILPVCFSYAGLVKMEKYYLFCDYKEKTYLVFEFQSNADFCPHIYSEHFCNWILQTESFPPHTWVPALKTILYLSVLICPSSRMA